MKASLQTGVILLFLGLTNLPAAVLYVDVNGPNPTPPYADWSTAATTIQDAVDAASAGDVIWVTNGVYQTGGWPAPGEILTNRVCVTNALTLQSVNGPAVTVISGYQVPSTFNGDTAVRCAHLADGSQLSGFTLVNGATRQINLGSDNQGNGGGVWCQSTNVTVSNCIIMSNCVSLLGAGVYSGTLRGCQIHYNVGRNACGGNAGGVIYSVVADSTIRSNAVSNSSGGNTSAGAAYCVVSNCIIEGNLSGGAYNCSLSDCTIQNNTNASNGGGAALSQLNHCTLSGNRSGNSGGGVYDCHLDNCLISSNWARVCGGGVYSDTGVTNGLGQNNQVIGNSALLPGGGIYLLGSSPGQTNRYLVNWMVLSNSSPNEGGGLYLSGFSVVDSCTFAGNSSGSNGGGFCSPYPQTFSIVSNSTFNGNQALGSGGGACRVALVNCLLSGNQAANGGGAYGLATNSVFTGNVATGNGGGLQCYSTPIIVLGCNFTNNAAANGGGASEGCFSNCVFAANSATTYGGGVYNAALNNCLVISNQAACGGGVYAGSTINYYPQTSFTYLGSKILGNSARNDGGGLYTTNMAWGGTNCLVEGNAATNNGGGLVGGHFTRCAVDGNYAATSGGGACNATLSLSVISNNVAGANGGGAYNANLGNCLVTDNAAPKGGGAYLGSLDNSTIVKNQATVAGGGTYFPSGGSINSCIIYDNIAPSGPNYSGSAAYNYCCTTPLPSGGPYSYNISSDPAFVDLAAGNYRLQTNSPCINTGGSPSTARDLDDRLRMVGTKIDIGAYEFQGPGFGEFIPWLQQHGLPTGGAADYTDSDRDGLNNWQEWLAGTDPTNSLSVLKMLTPVCTADGAGTIVSWQSVSNRTYFLQRSDALGTPTVFSTIQSNIAGQAGTTSYTNAEPPGTGASFYRVGIQ